MCIHSCLLCGGVLPPKFELSDIFSLQSITQKLVCRVCWDEFCYLPEQPTCKGCGRLMVVESLCSDCQKWNISSNELTNTAMFTYNSAMKEFMNQYKFSGDYRLRLVFTSFIKWFIHHQFKLNNLVIVPIPVSELTMQQ